jgi:hypothetical protein
MQVAFVLLLATAVPGRTLHLTLPISVLLSPLNVQVPFTTRPPAARVSAFFFGSLFILLTVST